MIWNPKTGKPYCNAIVWQDTRTDVICRKLARFGDINRFRKRVGLPLATYFSGPKIKWILDNNKDLRSAALKGEVLFGTMDTWLIWNLTGAARGGVHVTDVTNASRTMLMNLETLSWDERMLKAMEIPEKILPKITSSSEVFGWTNISLFKDKIPVAGNLGDQQAALFGQLSLEEGESKNTYGTGCFLLLNTGEKIIQSKSGLLTTVAYKIGKNKARYALEGSVAIAGALVQWFRDSLGLISKSKEIEELAKTVTDNGGIYFVPAFSGLFAPYWKSDARGVIAGLTHYVNKGHFARAILESTAFQTADILNAIEKDSGIKFKSLKVDGGMTVNELLMQFQADIINVKVIRPRVTETTVLGASYAAGLAVGFWKDTDELKKNWKAGGEFVPRMKKEEREFLMKNWQKAVARSFGWIS